MAPRRRYLVTGFPSFRGRKMVEHLLAAEPDAQLFLVIAEKLAAEAATHLEALPPEHARRVVALAGDAAAIDLGLSGAEYRDLTARVTHVQHLAQVTWPGVDRTMAEQVNLGATREIVEFARQCTALESVVLHSSAVVSGDRKGVVLEADLRAGQSFRTPVEQTLARAEALARRHMAELPLRVVRPTQIIGDSRTGEVDRFDGPYLLVMLIVSSPQELPVLLPARGDAPMNLVPIDYVVRASHHLGLSPSAAGGTFHLADPRPLSARRVFELVARAGGRRLPQGFIPTNLARAILNAPGLGLVTKSPRAFVELMATNVTWDARQADAALAGSGIVCPPFESYVDEIVGFVRRRVEERRQVRSEHEPDDPLG